jgi:HAD superfamily hydrolase (TIGR01509 family)
MTPRAVLFDMDGTLAISEETHHRALDDVLRALGIQKPAGFDTDMTGQSMRASYDYLKQQTTLTLGYAELAAAKYQAFLARIHELHWRTGAREAMQAAESAGCQIAVVTNSDRILLDASLRVLGIHRPDQITVSRNDVRDGKPHPEPYLRAAWLLGLQAGDCVVVEDSHTGSTAGLRAGMRVIGWPEVSAHGMPFPEGVCIADTQALWPTLKNQLDQTSIP